MHVILFGVDSGDAEGIYSLRALTDDDTVPTDTIVAFECLQDAERYATLLEATMSHKPDVVPISPGTAPSADGACIDSACHGTLLEGTRSPAGVLCCQANSSGERLQFNSQVLL